MGIVSIKIVSISTLPSVYYGIVWGRPRICFRPRAPPNNPTTERTLSLAQASTIFESGLYNCLIRCNEFRK